MERKRERPGRKFTVGLGSVAEVERLIICGMDKKATDQKVKL